MANVFDTSLTSFVSTQELSNGASGPGPEKLIGVATPTFLIPGFYAVQGGTGLLKDAGSKRRE